MNPETENYNKLTKTELINILETREAQAKQTAKIYYDCACGIRTLKAHKARHLRSQQHNIYEAKQDPEQTKTETDINKLSKLNLIKLYLKDDIDAIIKKQAKPTKDYYCECGAKTLRKALKAHLQSERHKAHEAKQH
jgi:predicted SprT family Zn-dependent metalloprotease